jgi:hypothetical protein
VGSDQPAIQIRAPGNFTPATNSSDEKSASRQPVEEKSVNVAHLPETIQRQTESGDAVATSADQQQDQGAEKKKASQAEPDLNDLANKVYKEVRHRLATEWERNRLK